MIFQRRGQISNCRRSAENFQQSFFWIASRLPRARLHPPESRVERGEISLPSICLADAETVNDRLEARIGTEPVIFRVDVDV
jgi:hypothetical protein